MLRQGRFRLAIACAATLVLTVPLLWVWHSSLLPTAYSIVDMSHVDDGGASHGGHSLHGGRRSGLLGPVVIRTDSSPM